MPEKFARPARLALYLFWFLNLALIANVWLDNRWRDVSAGGGSALIAIGALCGLIGFFCLLMQPILISGVRPVERPFGLDRLSRMHRLNGLIGYSLIMTHASLMILGNSSLSGLSWYDQYFELKHVLPYVFLASLGLFALNLVIVTSIVIVRRRLRYEWWRSVHMLVYATFALAFWHQLSNGHELADRPGFRAYWITLYIFALGSVVYMRWLRPLLLYARFRFRVDHVESAAAGVTSIYVTGERIERFAYEAGQFNFWYFWQPGFRTQKHPFTISSSPGDPYLRLTPKAIGDYTTALSDIRPGTPVLLNGPFGRFTMAVSAQRPRLFIAGGIGITPIRSMLGHGVREGDVLLYAARTEADLAFKADFDLYAKNGLDLHYILSEEKRTPKSFEHGQLDERLLKKLVPDLTERDVWLCGPPAMMSAVRQLLIQQGVPSGNIHSEEFRLG